jgi:hypothetical protein
MSTPDDLKTFREAAARAAAAWPAAGGDTNLLDVYTHAARIVSMLGVSLPAALPSKDVGVRLVELVDAELINGRLIRTLSPQEVSARAEALVTRIQAAGLLGHSIAVNYAITLFIWHGCIHMAKTLRPTYRTPTGEAPYSLEIRRHGYRIIERSWREAEAEGNPFVRFGVTLARGLEVGRGNRIIDAWVPRGSPYWEESA